MFVIRVPFQLHSQITQVVIHLRACLRSHSLHHLVDILTKLTNSIDSPRTFLDCPILLVEVVPKAIKFWIKSLLFHVTVMLEYASIRPGADSFTDLLPVVAVLLHRFDIALVLFW